MSEYFTQCKLFNADYSREIAWRIDSDGFLRCTTSVLKSCVMNYAPKEVADVLPKALKDKPLIKLYVPEDEVKSAEALKTLEGKPIRVGHEWQVGGNVEAVGNVAGSPIYNDDTKLLMADILVHDPEIIKRITNAQDDERLVDQSAAYLSDIEWSPGVTDSGEVYDGIQRNLRYNHIALLPKGRGRAGEEVRILNKKEDVNVTDYTLVKIGSYRVRVMNEDVEKLEDALEKKDKEMENEDESKDKELENAKSQIAILNQSIASITAEKDALLGQVDQLKQHISDVSSSTALANQVAEAVEEQNSAVEIMNSYPSEKLKEALDSAKKLFGHELRTHVINHVRLANKKTALSDEDTKNQDRIRGMFMALRDTAQTTKSTVSGQTVMRAMNEQTQGSGRYETVTDRLALKYQRYAQAQKAQEL